MRVHKGERDCALCLGMNITYKRAIRRYVCDDCGDTMVVSQAGTLIFAPVEK